MRILFGRHAGRTGACEGRQRSSIEAGGYPSAARRLYLQILVGSGGRNKMLWNTPDTTPASDTLTCMRCGKHLRFPTAIYWTGPTFPVRQAGRRIMFLCNRKRKTSTGTEITDITQTEAVGNMPGVQFFEYGKRFQRQSRKWIERGKRVLRPHCIYDAVYCIAHMIREPIAGEVKHLEWLSFAARMVRYKTFDNPDNKTVVYGFDKEV